MPKAILTHIKIKVSALTCLVVLCSLSCITDLDLTEPHPQIQDVASQAKSPNPLTMSETTIPTKTKDKALKVSVPQADIPTQLIIPTIQPLLAPTVIPTPTTIPIPPIIPTPTAIPVPPVMPTVTTDSGTTFTITIEVEMPPSDPILEAQVLSVISIDNSYWLELNMTSKVEIYDNVIKKVIINDSYEYVVRLSKHNVNQYKGRFNIDDYLLRQKTLQWVQDNLDIKINNFPERVACSGSMRPIIYCGDKVIYEPANYGKPLQEGDIVTFRQLVTDIDASTECPVYDDVITIFEGYIIHRIVQVLPSYNINRYMTRGDNNSEQDSCLVREEHMIHRVIDIIPRYYVIDGLQYDFSITNHQDLLKQRDILMNDYETVLVRYNNDKTADSAAAVNKAIKALDDNLTSIHETQQSITDAIYWDD